MFQFTEDCYLGVEQIDNEHMHLFDLLNEAVFEEDNDYGGDEYFKIKGLLDELDQYAEEHFAHEEAYMEKIRDPELLLQRKQHRAFREKIFEFLMRNIDNEDEQREALDEIVHYLAKWLYRHILSSDLMIGKLPPIEEWRLKEHPCEFTKEYMTGIEMIDQEHQTLFEIMGRAYHLIREWEEQNNYDDLDDFFVILTELRQYTVIHFADEEEYMKNTGYEGLAVQKRAHEAFVSRLNEIDVMHVQENPKVYLESLIQFLVGWLINHIQNEDKKIPHV